MNDELRQIIEARLKAEGSLQKDVGRVVLAACEGAEALAALLNENKTSAPAAKARAKARAAAILTSLTVEGFRGIGPAQTLTFNAGPGLTLVVGRNGSGKSSFAEALEVLFTGDSRRWSKPRSKIWKDGWRNLHHPHPAVIEAGLLLEEHGPAKITTMWDDEAPLESQKTVVQPKGKTKTSLEALGWTEALKSYRPFLSYNELGSLLDEGPSKLYDALAIVLGLEDLVSAQTTLAKARTELQQAVDLADLDREALIEKLKQFIEQTGDKRAAACLEAIESADWGLDTLEAILKADSDHGDDSDIDILRRAASLEVPDADQVSKAVTALREADDQLKAIEGTDADRSRKLAELLESALRFHQSHAGKDCPVCGTAGALGPSWSDATRQEIARLRKLAAVSDRAHALAEAARLGARALLPRSPVLLDKLYEIGLAGLDTARDAWNTSHAGASLEGLAELADHLEAGHPAFFAAIKRLKDEALKELQRREDRWGPLAKELAEWLPQARKAQQGAKEVPRIKAAEDWLKGAIGDIRNRRFAPIADQAMATWQFLRQNSNVELGRIKLAGTKGQRRVTLDVTVDGVDGAALGVMSQGELHSLALSLFLPRATMTESPFRFVVIDDPVQSMDPARVDGLARALEDIARTRQVIVFTHDDRLCEAVRRLGITTNILSVTRRPKSVVEVRKALDPVRAHIEDALALVHTTELPMDIMQRLVTGFCRSALEASFIQMVRRRQLNAGAAHTDVEDALKEAGKLTPLAALALFDDKDRGGEVMKRLNQFGSWAGDVFRQCKDGVHDGTTANLSVFIEDTQKLTECLVEIK